MKKAGYRLHDLLTLEDAAVEFSVSQRALRHAIQERKLDSYKPAKFVLVKWVDVNNWIESTRRPAIGARR